MSIIILLITAIIGVSLTLFSRAQNMLLLFLGLSLIFISALTFVIKKNARLLFFPFIIIMGTVFFVLNRLDFRPNTLRVAFFDPSDYLPSIFAGEQEFPTEAAIPYFPYDDDEVFQIIFRKQPLISGNDFVLSGIQTTEQRLEAVWDWTGESKWVPISSADYLHIYDPLFNIYYPDEVNALFLDERLEFSLLDFSAGPVPFTTKLAINDLYYLSQPTQFSFNSPLKQLIIKSENDELQPNYQVWVNGETLTFEKTDEGWHYYSFHNQVIFIDEIQIIETSLPHPLPINYPTLTFNALYVVENDPSPIIIDNISLSKYFGRINQFLPSINWDAEAILSNFSAINGSMTSDKGLVHLIPEGIQTALHHNLSTSMVTAQGLSRLSPFILAGNIIVMVLLLSSFVLSSLLINKHLESIRIHFRKFSQMVKKIITTQPGDYQLHRITPFKIFFFIFLILSWIVFLISSVQSFFLVIAFILSTILVYYVIADIEFKK